MALTVDQWFEQERGIISLTLDAYKVKRGENECWIPYPNGEKRRSGFQEGDERKFQFTAGVTPDLLEPPCRPQELESVFIVEGETDAMRLWQELGTDTSAVVYGLAGVNTWKREFVDVIGDVPHVFVILDNESEYDNPRAYDAVEACWKDIRRDIPKAKRIKLPMGIKDLCEFFSQYDMDTLRLLAKKPSTASRFKALDLSKAPPPPNWLLEGLIARGDVTLISGASGLGKSWLTMGLAVAVADGWETYLGCEVTAHGKVLYFDEENPEDVVYSRLRKLGLQNLGNVRYVWNNGVRVDRDPEAILEEALEFKPELLVLDSFTRIHTKEENLAGDIAPLLNDGIKPLARDTGAAVVLIHHHDKAGNGPRGSGDITASVDGALDVYGGFVPGQFSLKLTKSRRRLSGDDITVKIVDIDNDTVKIKATELLDAPF